MKIIDAKRNSKKKTLDQLKKELAMLNGRVVLAAQRDGYNAREISEMLTVSPATVKNHMKKPTRSKVIRGSKVININIA